MNRSGAHGFASHFLLCTALTLGGFGSVGVGMVWIRHQISLAANANKALQGRLAALERRIEENDAAIAGDRDPAVLSQLNTQWNLGLVPPASDKVKRVTEDPVVRLASKHNRGLFGERTQFAEFRVALEP